MSVNAKAVRVVFMGTPQFAVPSLEALASLPVEVVGVFTQPDRPVGRGHRLTACPVKLRKFLMAWMICAVPRFSSASTASGVWFVSAAASIANARCHAAASVPRGFFIFRFL